MENLFTQYNLDRFKVFQPKTLFPLTAEEFVKWLSQNKCPLCQHKLYLNRQKTKAFCKSKFKDKFFISSQRLLANGGTLV